MDAHVKMPVAVRGNFDSLDSHRLSALPFSRMQLTKQPLLLAPLRKNATLRPWRGARDPRIAMGPIPSCTCNQYTDVLINPIRWFNIARYSSIPIQIFWINVCFANIFFLFLLFFREMINFETYDDKFESCDFVSIWLCDLEKSKFSIISINWLIVINL